MYRVQSSIAAAMSGVHFQPIVFASYPRLIDRLIGVLRHFQHNCSVISRRVLGWLPGTTGTFIICNAYPATLCAYIGNRTRDLG